MKQEEKELLLKDLSARLPYGVKITFSSNGFHWDWEQTLEEIRQCEDGEYAINGWGIHGIKPYLRQMSSMTEEEEIEYDATFATIKYDDGHYDSAMTYKSFDFLNKKMFDYRGLIPKALAIEVTEDNNPYKD